MSICPQIGAYIRVSGGKCVACPKGCIMSETLEGHIRERSKTDGGDAFARCRVCISSEEGILTGQLLCNEQPNFHPIVGGCGAFTARRPREKEVEA